MTSAVSDIAARRILYTNRRVNEAWLRGGCIVRVCVMTVEDAGWLKPLIRIY